MAHWRQSDTIIQPCATLPAPQPLPLRTQSTRALLGRASAKLRNQGSPDFARGQASYWKPRREWVVEQDWGAPECHGGGNTLHQCPLPGTSQAQARTRSLHQGRMAPGWVSCHTEQGRAPPCALHLRQGCQSHMQKVHSKHNATMPAIYTSWAESGPRLGHHCVCKQQCSLTPCRGGGWHTPFCCKTPTKHCSFLLSHRALPYPLTAGHETASAYPGGPRLGSAR